MNRVSVSIRSMSPYARLPEYASERSSGADLVAAIAEPLRIDPGTRTVLGTGLAIALPDGYEGQVRSRSGWAAEHGLVVLNAPGTIDSDYRGEVKVLLINLGEESVTIEPGARVAQLVIVPVAQADFQFEDSLSETKRGSGGLGHSGGM